MVTWLDETVNWLYHTFSLDLNFVIFPLIVAIMLTLVRVTLHFLIFKVKLIIYTLVVGHQAAYSGTRLGSVHVCDDSCNIILLQKQPTP